MTREDISYIYRCINSFSDDSGLNAAIAFSIKQRLSRTDSYPDHDGRPGQVGGSLPRGCIVGPNGVICGEKAGKDNDLSKYGKYGKRAQKLYDKLRDTAPQFSKDVIDIGDKLGGRPSGLEYCIKTAESITGKLDRWKKQNDEAGVKQSYSEMIGNMTDINRYTLLCDHESTAKFATGAIDELKSKGYSIERISNKWTDPRSETYKGIHIIASKDGVSMELQIHSNESLEVKNINHKLYEEERNVKTSPDRKRELRMQQYENAKSLRYPPGIEKIYRYHDDSADLTNHHNGVKIVKKGDGIMKEIMYAMDYERPKMVFKRTDNNGDVKHFVWNPAKKQWVNTGYDTEKLFNGMSDSKEMSTAEVAKITSGIL